MIAVEKLSTSNHPDDVGLLLGSLKDENWKVREAIAKAFWKIKDIRAIRPLSETLNDKHSSVVQAAVVALGRYPDAQAVQPVIAALENSHFLVRACAADALGNMGDRRAIEPLITTLRDESGYVRERAAIALTEIGDTRALVPLLKGVAGQFLSLQDLENHRQRLIQRLGSESAVPLLIASLEDESCAEAAMNDLQFIGWEPATDREQALIAFAKRDTKKLAGLGSVSVDLLVKGFRQWDEPSQVSAAKALDSLDWQPSDEAEAIWFALDTGRMNSLPPIGSEGLKILETVLSAKLVPYGYDAERRITAIRILEEKGGERSVEIFGAVLGQSTYVTVKSAAITALRKIGSPSAVRTLAHALTSIPQTEDHLEELTEALVVIAPGWTAGALHTVVENKGLALNVIRGIGNALRRSATDVETTVLREILSLGKVIEIMRYRPDLLDNFDKPESFPQPWEAEVDCSEIKALAQSELMRRGDE